MRRRRRHPRRDQDLHFRVRSRLSARLGFQTLEEVPQTAHSLRREIFRTSRELPREIATSHARPSRTLCQLVYSRDGRTSYPSLCTSCSEPSFVGESVAIRPAHIAELPLLAVLQEPARIRLLPPPLHAGWSLMPRTSDLAFPRTVQHLPKLPALHGRRICAACSNGSSRGAHWTQRPLEADSAERQSPERAQIAQGCPGLYLYVLDWRWVYQYHQFYP